MGKIIKTIFFTFLISCLFSFGENSAMAQRFVTQEQGACHRLDRGEIDEAIEILQKILEANQDNLNARLFLGIAFYMKKDFGSASKEFVKVEKEVDKVIGASRPFGDEAMFTTMGMDRKSEFYNCRTSR